LGGTTAALWHGAIRSWTCLEPDAELAARISFTTRGIVPESALSVRVGQLNVLPDGLFFDTIIYIDVLEHIEDDRMELKRAAGFLRPEGRLVVLSPAHPFLYSAWDRALGHCRRYTRHALHSITPSTMTPICTRHLDSLGATLSFANRTLLKQGKITSSQVQFWDKTVIPLSRLIDPILGRFVGRSVVVAWKKTNS
jgi:hypothetical protein